MESEISSPTAVFSPPFPSSDMETVTSSVRDGLSSVGANINIVDFSTGNIHLIVGNTLFKSHRHILNKFTTLKEYINSSEKAHPGRVPVVKIDWDAYSEVDFENMFKILYTLVFEGPFEFDAPVLISALRIASTYGCPALKTFCIAQLGDVQIAPKQRQKLARECDIAEWEKQAYKELSAEIKTLSAQHAQTLGVNELPKVTKVEEEGQQQDEQQQNNQQHNKPKQNKLQRNGLQLTEQQKVRQQKELREWEQRQRENPGNQQRTHPREPYWQRRQWYLEPGAEERYRPNNSTRTIALQDQSLLAYKRFQNRMMHLGIVIGILGLALVIFIPK